MATVTKGKTFISGETVEPADMHQLVDSATVTNIVNADIASDAAIAGSKLAAGAITDTQLATGAVTDTQLATGAVTGAAGGGKIAASAITGQTQLTDPLADGDEFLVHDTSASALRRVAYSSVRPLTLATAQVSTSGTSIDFTGIPSWAKRITVMFDGVSTSGSSVVMVQIGDSGGVENTGYNGVVANQGSTAAAYSALSSGFSVTQQHGAAVVFYGQMILSTLGSNIWAATGCVGRTDALFLGQLQGAKTLSDTLTQVRITTANGTDTFDAGTINISYE